MAAPRALGIVLLVLGVLAVLGGLGWSLRAYLDQDENNDGFFTDPERGQENKQDFFLGLYVAGGGLVLTIVGLVLTRPGARASAT